MGDGDTKWQTAPAGPAPSDTYTHGHHQSVLRTHRRRTAGDSAGYLLPHLRPGHAVLDVGCGPGSITVGLAQRVAPGHVTGVDNAVAALDEARATADRAETANVSFTQRDVYRLGFDDRTFDIVHAHQVLQHLTDPIAALREMRRVCKPRGLIAVRDADYAAMTWHPADARLDRWLALYRQVARANGAEPDAGRRLHAWARAAGLAEITPSASAWCYATPEDRTWWGQLWAERIGHSSLAAQALARELTTPDELEEIAAAWQGWASHEDGWFAILHGEVLGR